nr:DNA internalization-related competence protein ComEC/Rec2 [Desulfuromonas sp. TF]
MGPPLFLLSYALGLGCAPFLDISPAFASAPFIVAILCFIARASRVSGILLAAFFFVLGISLYHLRTTPPGDSGHIRAFISDRPVAVEGAVLSVGNRPFGRSVIDLETHRVISEGIAAPARGKLRLYIRENNPPAAPGDTIRFLSRLRAPRAFGTPGEFDFSRHLAGQGIFVTAFLPQAKGIVKTGSQRPHGPASLIAKQRTDVAGIIDRAVDPTLAPLVRALVIGDKGEITPDQRELMGRAGISHLFAISGLHLGLIAAFLYVGGRFFYRRCESLLLFGPPRRYLPPLLLPLLWAYLLFTGSGLPTLRAFIMTLAGALLFLGARRTPPLKLLTATALLILCLEPLALFAPSFQLSFAGVLGLLVLLPRWQPGIAALPRPLRKPASLAAATLAATITTAPLVLFHFHLLAPAGLIANMAAVPAIGFLAVPLGIGGALLSSFWPGAAAPLLQGCGLLIEKVLTLAEWIVSLPLMEGSIVYASPLQIAAAFLLAATLLLPGGLRRCRPFRGTLLTFAALFLLWQPAPTGLTVTALSVGQGDATLLSLEDGRHYLVDGGGLYSETFDVGERLVAPALGRLGVRSLEAVILTHDDLDHRQGLQHILESFPVKAFWSSTSPDAIHTSLRSVIERRKIPVVQVPQGWTVLDDTRERSLSIYNPSRLEYSLNDNSLVLYARILDEGVLLTGDMEEAGVSGFLAADPPQPVTLLKLPHHGSHKSSPELLLERFEPAVAFVSAGAGNPYHLPHQSVMDDLRQREIPVHRTDRQGSLQFSTTGRGWRAKQWEKGLFH